MGIVANDWIPYFKEESEKEYYKKLTKTMASEYASRQIFPPKDQIFSAFLLTPYKDVKVVILGQDPYHNLRLSIFIRNFTMIWVAISRITAIW